MITGLTKFHMALQVWTRTVCDSCKFKAFYIVAASSRLSMKKDHPLLRCRTTGISLCNDFTVCCWYQTIHWKLTHVAWYSVTVIMCTFLTQHSHNFGYSDNSFSSQNKQQTRERTICLTHIEKSLSLAAVTSTDWCLCLMCKSRTQFSHGPTSLDNVHN